MTDPKDTIEQLLRIPITKVEKVDYSKVMLFFEGKKIGSLPVYYRAGGIVTYGDDKATLLNLNWMPIFKRYEDEFISNISLLLKRADLNIFPGPFAIIYVKDHNANPLGTMKAAYVKGEWTFNKYP